MEQLRFSFNWNKKLHNDFFTTLRQDIPNRFHKGKKFEVFLKAEKIGIAEVIDVRTVMLSAVNDWIFALDTGYIGEEGKEIFRKMYKVKQGDDLKLSLVLFRYTEKG